MKRYLLINVACFVFLVTLGCTTTTATAPIFYTNNPNTEFEVLGTVSTRSGNRAGYIDLFNEAKRQFPETDFVIDIMIDQHTIKTSYHWIAFLFAQLFYTDVTSREFVRYEYVMRGTAIRYIK